MENEIRNVYYTKDVIIYAIILALLASTIINIESLPDVNNQKKSVFVLIYIIVKHKHYFVILDFLIFLYLILCFWFKKLKFNKKTIEIYYSLRPFAKLYQYQYKDITKVYYDCGASLSYFKFTLNKKHPWWIFKKKRIWFYNDGYESARNIVKILKENGVSITISGPANGKCQRYVNGEDVKWD